MSELGHCISVKLNWQYFVLHFLIPCLSVYVRQTCLCMYSLFWNWYFNPLPNDKILGFPKLKAFSDDKSNVIQIVKVVFHRTENIVGKEENAGYQHFLLFPQYFLKAFSSSASKVVIVW